MQLSVTSKLISTVQRGRCFVAWCQVEAKIFQLQELMAERGYTEEEIEAKVSLGKEHGSRQTGVIDRVAPSWVSNTPSARRRHLTEA